MLSRERMVSLFERVNEELKKRGEVGEVGIVGGAVMCLVYNARNSTRDVGAIFEPAKILRKIAETIAQDEGLAPDWLNDGAKGYIQPGFLQQDVLSLSNLRVWAPEPKYMLAMKCISARWDTSDRDDVTFLIRFLDLQAPQDVFSIIETYYPKNQILAKTKFFLEELMEE